ncbi:MAG: molybdopterin-binding protein [Myxococcota bacterium]
MPTRMSSAGILIIGNEILTGKVEDANAPFLLRELRLLGVDVERVHVIPDEVEVIAQEVRQFSRAYDYVLTTGGVGPTHDDVTMEGIASAFGRKLARQTELEDQLRRALRGREPNESLLRMTLVPEGAGLIMSEGLWFPLVTVENVFIFPGIPSLLQKKFHETRHRFKGSPVFLRRVYVTAMESDVAEDLNRLLEEFPDLQLGSYPKLDESYRTLLTLESRDEDYVSRALSSLLTRLSGEVVLRVE